MEMKHRILFLMPDLPGGGAEKVLLDILRHFDCGWYDVTLLLEFKKGIYVRDVPEQVRLKVLPAGIRAFRRLGRALPFCNALFRRLVRRYAGNGYDTIISFMEGPAVRLHSFLNGCASRNVSWVHIDMSRKHWSEAYFDGLEDERAAYKDMDEVVFVSQQAKEGFEKIFGDAGGHHSVVYNLIDAAQIRSIAGDAASDRPSGGPFTISMAGRMNRQKRYDRALEAAALLQSQGCDFRLRVAGDGELLPEMKETAARLGLSDRVEFLGFRKPAYADLAAADVFLNSSEAEGYPLTLCEALCLGLPVVATDVSGAREILGDSQYGIVVPQTAEAIADALMELYGNPAGRERLRARALLRSESFDVAGTMKRIYDIIDGKD